MVVSPFSVDDVDYVDASTLDPDDAERFAKALAAGLRCAPFTARCAPEVDPDGEYPIVKLAGFCDGKLMHAWWFGCNEEQPGSTADDPILATRLWQGVFHCFETECGLKLLEHMLEAPIPLEGGGSVHFVEFCYSFDVDELSSFPEFNDYYSLRGDGLVDFTDSTEGGVVSVSIKKLSA